MTTTADAEALVRRVLDAVPARSHALGALLQLFRVEATEDVPTACVSCERRPVLRVNPRFVEEHCRTDAHLFLLVMHELHHVLLGHTRLFPRVTPAHNVAFDAVINALLCVRFPEEAYTSFFTQQYGKAKGPLRLLAPPEGTPVEPARLAALHAALYEGRATAQEVFHAIVTEVEITPDVLGALLGSHGGREGEWGTEGPADPSVVDAIRRIVEKWPPPEKPIRGRSLADVLKGEIVDARPGRRRRPSWPRRARRSWARPTVAARTRGARKGRGRRSCRFPTLTTGERASRARSARRRSSTDRRSSTRAGAATAPPTSTSTSAAPWTPGSRISTRLSALSAATSPPTCTSSRPASSRCRSGRSSEAVARRPAAPTSRASSSTRWPVEPVACCS